LEREIFNKMHGRIVKSLLNAIVLAKLRERDSPMSGYDVITFIHKKFHIWVSLGTVYHLLYCMERDGLIKGSLSGRKRVYVLTEKGEETIKVILNAYEKIVSFVANLLK